MITPIDVALSQLGVRELTNKNDGVPAERYAGGRQEPWCSHFVLWCFQMCGFMFPGWVQPTPKRINPLAHVKTFHMRLTKEGYIVDHVDAGENDIVIFNSRGDSDAGTGWHIGIVKEVVGGMVHTVEGNSSNGVHERAYPLTDKRIVAFARHPGLRDNRLLG